MGIIRKLCYKPHFVSDKFDKKYPFELKNQIKGHFKTFGEKNPDKTFYVIWRDFLGAGFFSNFAQVLSHMKVAYHLGMIPVVDFENFKTLYNEKDPINNSHNAWEYYLKQVSPYSLEEVYQSKRVFFCNGEPPSQTLLKEFCDETDENFYKGTSYKDFISQHIHLQNNVAQELEKYAHFFNEPILGIHFRGKEQNVAQLHGFGATVAQMFKYTDEIFAKFNIQKIFLVTEDRDYLDAFIQKYGDKVLYSNAFRTAKTNAYNLVDVRPNHRYLLGLDAIVDSLLLSKCSGLLYSCSGISAHSAKIGDHQFTYYIDNGLNYKKWYLAKFAFRVKKLLPKKFGGLKDEVKITLQPIKQIS